LSWTARFRYDDDDDLAVAFPLLHDGRLYEEHEGATQDVTTCAGETLETLMMLQIRTKSQVICSMVIDNGIVPIQLMSRNTGKGRLGVEEW